MNKLIKNVIIAVIIIFALWAFGSCGKQESLYDDGFYEWLFENN